jgi:hypothetical protein
VLGFFCLPWFYRDKEIRRGDSIAFFIAPLQLNEDDENTTIVYINHRFQVLRRTKFHFNVFEQAEVNTSQIPMAEQDWDLPQTVARSREKYQREKQGWRRIQIWFTLPFGKRIWKRQESGEIPNWIQILKPAGSSRRCSIKSIINQNCAMILDLTSGRKRKIGIENCK